MNFLSIFYQSYDLTSSSSGLSDHQWDCLATCLHRPSWHLV